MDVVVEIGGWEHSCCGSAIERGQLVDLGCLRVDGRGSDCSIKLALLLDEDRDDPAEAERVLRAAAAAGELFAWNNLGLVLRDQSRLLEAEDAFQRGARGGDALAAKNLRSFRRDHRRQLGRAHRRARRRPVDGTPLGGPVR